KCCQIVLCCSYLFLFNSFFICDFLFSIVSRFILFSTAIHYSALSRNSLNFSAHLSKKRFRSFGSFSSFLTSFSTSFPTGSCLSSSSISFGGNFVIKDDFPLLSKLFNTRPTAVAYIGLVVSASLSPAKCSFG